jgi:hypothetical protein
MITNRAGRLALALAAAACAAAAALPASASESGLSGAYYKTDDDKFIFRIVDCGAGEICADLVWLLRPLEKDTRRPKTDEFNPDPALRGQPVCGMRLVTGLHPNGDGEWNNGRFYNPDDGRSFNAFLRDRDGELSIRAYLGVVMLGKTMRLRPVEAPTESCDARAAAAMADIENYFAETPGSPWVKADD